MNRLWLLEWMSCSFMTGLILLIHFVHYPSFAYIRSIDFKNFSAFHSKTITLIVLPAMAVELLAAIALCYLSISWVAGLNLGSVVVLWLITGFKSAVTHGRFAVQGFNSELLQDLLKWNRYRTFIWGLRFILMGIYVLTKIN